MLITLATNGILPLPYSCASRSHSCTCTSDSQRGSRLQITTSNCCSCCSFHPSLLRGTRHTPYLMKGLQCFESIWQQLLQLCYLPFALCSLFIILSLLDLILQLLVCHFLSLLWLAQASLTWSKLHPETSFECVSAKSWLLEYDLKVSRQRLAFSQELLSGYIILVRSPLCSTLQPHFWLWSYAALYSS